MWKEQNKNSDRNKNNIPKKNNRKKYIILVLSAVFFIFSVILLASLFKSSLTNNSETSGNITNEENEIYKNTNLTNKESKDLEDLEKSNNELNTKPKIDLSLYLEKNGVKTLITSHTCSWEPENVMGIFYAVPCKETTLHLNTSFDVLWKEYISDYENYSDIRIGYNISFTLNTGETVDRTILNPDDAYYMFPKVMVFLYDDVNLVPGKRYYHITQDDMDENTICSSIKLVGDVKTKNIVSDITLTAFCYSSKEDFDKETGRYTR